VTLPRLSPAAYRRITAFALVALVVIIVTGGAVRLTGSGLGCSDWPTCEQNRLVAPLDYHPMVEFTNRVFTGLVSVAVVLAVLGSVLRVPRRRDLTWLSLGLVAGVIGQIVLGGITVLFHLWPPLVMGHFVLSMILVANAVVLHHRAGRPPGQGRLLVAPDVRVAGRLLLVAAALAVFTGTIVTGAGPHGGDEKVDRLPLYVHDAARIHGTAVWLFLALTLAIIWMMRRTGAPETAFRLARQLVWAIVVQGAIGYTQYFTGVPVLLVAIHILGATLVWLATLRFVLHLRAPAEAVEVVPLAAAPLPAS
jgi:cytochrome c oxidase assembly protein subunit 15